MLAMKYTHVLVTWGAYYWLATHDPGASYNPTKYNISDNDVLLSSIDVHSHGSQPVQQMPVSTQPYPIDLSFIKYSNLKSIG
jgi:hypothetical protein